MSRLQKRLDAIRAGFEAKAPPVALETMHRSTRDLATLLAESPAIGVGDRAPAFRLPDQDGHEVGSAELLEAGPLIMTFFRGHW